MNKTISKVRGFCSRHGAKAAVAIGGIGAGLAIAAPAGAASGDPADITGDVMTAATGQMTPVITAILLGGITVTVLWWAGSKVYSFFKGRNIRA